MSQGDTALAARLREEIGNTIQRETQSLIVAPASEHDRMAGHIQGMQDALRMLDGSYAAINNPRPTK